MIVLAFSSSVPSSKNLKGVCRELILHPYARWRTVTRNLLLFVQEFESPSLHLLTKLVSQTFTILIRFRLLGTEGRPEEIFNSGELMGAWRLPMKTVGGLLCLALLMTNLLSARASPPAQFIFGDSLVDPGNNNYLIASLAKANFRPNGIDRPDHEPTGRFCNNAIIPDLIGEAIGIPNVLPVLDPRAHGQNLLIGANFASAGTGILNDTGSIFIQHITIAQQYQLYKRVQGEVAFLLGPEEARKLFSQAMYSFTVGGNDYINNYVLQNSQRRRQYTPDKFLTLLISTFREQLVQIYNLGARKIVVAGIGPLGCVPSQLSTLSKSGECIDSLNQYAISFNNALKPMLESLRAQLPGAHILFSESYNIAIHILNNAAEYGFTDTNTACCGTGRFNGMLTCSSLVNLCSNRRQHFWWDPFHPSDAVNRIVTNRLMNGPPSDISPMNVNQLLAI